MRGEGAVAPSIAIDVRIRSPTIRSLVTVDASGHAIETTLVALGPDALLSISSPPKRLWRILERCPDDAEHAMKFLCMSLDKTTNGRRPKKGAGRSKTVLPTCALGTGECPLAAVRRPYAGRPRTRGRVRISKER